MVVRRDIVGDVGVAGRLVAIVHRDRRSDVFKVYKNKRLPSELCQKRACVIKYPTVATFLATTVRDVTPSPDLFYNLRHPHHQRTRRAYQQDSERPIRQLALAAQLSVFRNQRLALLLNRL